MSKLDGTRTRKGLVPRAKVLHVITNLQVGGATDNTLLTVAGHSRTRYEVHLAAGVSSDSDNDVEWRDRAQECADRLFIVPEMRRQVRIDRDFRALWTLMKLVAEHRYDIVHTHCSKAGLLGRVAARRVGGPIVVHTYHAFGWQVTYEKADGLWRHAVSRVARSVYLGLDKYAASLSDALITVSDLNQQMAVGLGLAPPEKFTTVRSGIDLNRPSALPDRSDSCRHLGLDPARPIAGTVARLVAQKDPLTFVDAAKRVLARKPDVQFIIIGQGPLERRVRTAIGHESRIRMLGYRNDVSDILRVMDVFVLSSRWEGLGRALTEAVGAGVPVAATRVDGIPELITHGVTGRLSPPGEAAALAENVEWILDHPAEARRMADRAAGRVHEKWGLAAMVEGIETLYDRLLAGHRPGAPARGIASTASASG